MIIGMHKYLPTMIRIIEAVMMYMLVKVIIHHLIIIIPDSLKMVFLCVHIWIIRHLENLIHLIMLQIIIIFRMIYYVFFLIMKYPDFMNLIPARYIHLIIISIFNTFFIKRDMVTYSSIPRSVVKWLDSRTV